MQNPVSNNQTPAAASLQDYHQRHLATQQLQQQHPSHAHPQQQQQHPSHAHPQQQQQQQHPSHANPQQQQQQHPSYAHPQQQQQQQQQHWNRPIVMHWKDPHSSLPYNTTAGLPRAAAIVTNPRTTARVVATNHQHYHLHPDRSGNNRSATVKRKWQEIGRTSLVQRTDMPPSATSNTNTIPRYQNPPLARNVAAAALATAATSTSNNTNNGVHNSATVVERSKRSIGNNNNSAPNSMGSIEVSSGIPSDSLGEGLAWPEGWTKTTRKRMGGKTAGTYDSYWISPLSKFKLRSIPEVKRFLAAVQMHGGDEQLARKEFRKKKTTGTATTATISVEAECPPSLQKSPSLIPSKTTALHDLQAARPSAIAPSTHIMSAGAAAAAAITIAAKIALSAAATTPLSAESSTPTPGIPTTAQQKDSSSGSGAHSNVPMLPQRPLPPQPKAKTANTVAVTCPPVVTLTQGGGPLTATLAVPAQRTTTLTSKDAKISSKAILAATATATTSSVISVDSSDEIEFPNDHVVL